MKVITHRLSGLPLPMSTLCFLLLSVAALVAHANLPEESVTAPWLWVTALVLLGLPHGAVDPLLFAGNSTTSRAGFYASYLASIGVAGLVWWRWPLLALIAFLGMSIWHFAHDWCRQPPRGQVRVPSLLGYSAACALVVLPSTFHPQWVAEAFTALLRDAEPARALQQGLAMLAPAVVATLIAGACMAMRSGALADTVEVAVLVLIAVVLPPVISFTLYFCCIHSPRHLAEVARCTPSLARLGWTAFLFTGITAVCAGLALWIPGKEALESSLTAVVFIGLAVLTVPHLWVVARWQRRLVARESQDPTGAQAT